MEEITRRLRYLNINRLLTEREGQYSPVRPEQARLVSCLLYGTLFLIVKCTSGAINLFSFLSFSFLSFHLFNLFIFQSL